MRRIVGVILVAVLAAILLGSSASATAENIYVLKIPHENKTAADFVANDTAACLELDPPLGPGEVLWHFVMSGLDDGSITHADLTALGVAGLAAAKITGNGSNAQWNVLNPPETNTGPMGSVFASTDGIGGVPERADNSSLRVSHTCIGPPPNGNGANGNGANGGVAPQAVQAAPTFTG